MPKLKKRTPRTPDSDPNLEALYGPLETALDESDRLLHRQHVFTHDHSHGKNVFCRDFQHGKCRKGDDDCTWSHDRAFEWEFSTRERRKMKKAVKAQQRKERRDVESGDKKRKRGNRGEGGGVYREHADDVDVREDREEAGV